MSTRTHPTVAVFGATGQQGSAVIRALLQSNEFHVRAVTRTPESEAARKLLSEYKTGLELAVGDLTDVKSLRTTLSGVWGVFLVTLFYPKQGAMEEKLVKDAADVALQAGVRFFVFSSLPDALALSNSSHPVEHFTAKNRAEQYIRTLPFPEGSAFPNAGCFASNFLHWMAPKKSDKDGVYEFSNVIRYDVALPIVDIEEEFSALVSEIFRHPKKYNGQSIFTGTYYTYPQWAAAFTAATGKPSRYVQLSATAAGKTFSEEVYDMFTYFNDAGYYGGADVHHSLKKTDALAFWKRYSNRF